MYPSIIFLHMIIKTEGNIKILSASKSADYYFIRPFEMLSSYSQFLRTWEIANNYTLCIPDVSLVSLLKSLNNESKFGFLSFSKWSSRESFKRLNLHNPVFKNHNAFDFDGKGSANNYLYKLLNFTMHNVAFRTHEIVYLLMFEDKYKTEDGFSGSWNEFCYAFKDKIQSAFLFKSVYRNSRFRFVSIITPRQEYPNVFNYFDIDGYSGFNRDRMDIYSSLYMVAKKIKHNRKNINKKI